MRTLKLRQMAMSAAVIAFAATSAQAAGSVVSAEVTAHPNGDPPFNQGTASGQSANLANEISLPRIHLNQFESAAAARYKPGFMTVSTHALLASHEDKVTSDVMERATSSVTDTLTISSPSQDGRRVLLHKELRLDSDSTFYTFADGDGPFSMKALLRTELSGDGIAPGPFGTSTFAMEDFELTQSTSRHGVLKDPQSIAFDLEFILGEAKDFSVTLSQFSNVRYADFDGDTIGIFIASNVSTLDWLYGGTLRDAMTGETLCGLSSTSASGFDYLEGVLSPACPGGGSGGSPVPEPSLWAVFIAGFGLAGTAVRRRRGDLVPS